MDCPLLVSQLQTHPPATRFSWGVGPLLTLPIGGARERMNSRGGKGASGFPLFKAALTEPSALRGEPSALAMPLPQGPGHLCFSSLPLLPLAAFSSGVEAASPAEWSILLKIPSFEIPPVSSDFLTGS